MNTEQIIKALEKEYDRHHKLEEDLNIELHLTKNLKKVLALIKKQEAEIEKYKNLAELRLQDNKDTCELLFKEEDKNKELQAQVENLKKENKYLRESLADEREHKEDMKGE